MICPYVDAKIQSTYVSTPTRSKHEHVQDASPGTVLAPNVSESDRASESQLQVAGAVAVASECYQVPSFLPLSSTRTLGDSRSLSHVPLKLTLFRRDYLQALAPGLTVDTCSFSLFARPSLLPVNFCSVLLFSLLGTYHHSHHTTLA